MRNGNKIFASYHRISFHTYVTTCQFFFFLFFIFGLFPLDTGPFVVDSRSTYETFFFLLIFFFFSYFSFRQISTVATATTLYLLANRMRKKKSPNTKRMITNERTKKNCLENIRWRTTDGSRPRASPNVKNDIVVNQSNLTFQSFFLYHFWFHNSHAPFLFSLTFICLHCILL